MSGNFTPLEVSEIAATNDLFRAQRGIDDSVGKWVFSDRVQREGKAFVDKAQEAIRRFDDFGKDRLHQSGGLYVGGKTVWFKLDILDQTYTAKCENPLDLKHARRVLSVMFPSETMPRNQQLNMVYQRTHSDFKGRIDGVRTIMVLRQGGSTLVRLDDLTEAEIDDRLPWNPAKI